MREIIDMIGKKFGKLTVLSRGNDEIKKDGSHVIQYICECECGNIVEVRGTFLRSGHTTSCGCAHIKHGRSNSREYKIFQGVKQRCYNPNFVQYADYGGRGIYVCDEWLNGETGIANYLDWVDRNINDPDHGYKEDRTIARIDNDGPYAPWNCRWEDKKEQANNTRNNLWLTWNGKTKTASEWADLTELPVYVIYDRYHRGWDIFDVLNVPLNSHLHKIKLDDGKYYTTAEISKMCGIPRDIIFDRIVRLHWNHNTAMNTPVLEHYKMITYNGDTLSYADWDRARGYAPGTVGGRIRRGWTEEEALNGKPDSRKPKVPMNAIYFIKDDTLLDTPKD